MLGGKIRETEVAGGARRILEVKQLVLAMVKWRSEEIPRWEVSSEGREVMNRRNMLWRLEMNASSADGNIQSGR